MAKRNLLKIPGTIFIRLKAGSSVYSGQASSSNLKFNYDETRDNAIKNALHEAFAMGENLELIKDEAKQNFSNTENPYEEVVEFFEKYPEAIASNIEIVEEQTKYIGEDVKKTPQNPKYQRVSYVSKRLKISEHKAREKIENNEIKAKKLLTVKRENWKNPKTGKGRYVTVGRRDDGKIVSWTKWSSK